MGKLGGESEGESEQFSFVDVGVIKFERVQFYAQQSKSQSTNLK